MSAPIFISFSSKDHKIAQSVCDALESRGFRCWVSSRDVRPGQNYQEEISRAIRTAKVMLLVFTANANASEEIKKEVALAGRAKTVVIPLRVENVAPNDAFDYEFATRQWIDAFDGWDEALGNLTAQIATLVPPEQTTASGVAASAAIVAPPPTASGPTLTFSRRIQIAAAAVILAIAGAIAWHYLSGSKSPPMVATTEPVPSTPSTPAPPSADPFPHRRPGLWVQRTAAPGVFGPPFITKICIDKATETALIAAGQGAGRKNCSMVQSQTVGTATISDATCTVGALTVTSHTVGKFTGDTAFELTTKSHTTGPNAPPDSTVVTTGAWSGACPPNLKPGDLQTPDGQVTHLTTP